MVYNTRTKNSRDDWETPIEVFLKIQKFLKLKFTLDPCTNYHNRKCKKWCEEFPKDPGELNGLEAIWNGETLFINSPYNDKETWLKKGISELKDSHLYNDPTILAYLLPSATDTKWFHKYVWQANEIYFLKSRIQFLPKRKSGNNIGSMVVVFRSNVTYEENFSPKVSLMDWKSVPITLEEREEYLEGLK